MLSEHLSRRVFAACIALAALLALSVPGHATIYAVDYTGTVDATYSYTGAPLPSGVATGAAVTGAFSFDTSFAGTPAYSFTSCSGSCGGDAVAAYFNLSAHLTESVTIAGNTWSADLGEVWLDDDYTIPGVHFQAIGVDNGKNGYNSSLGVYFSRKVGAQILFGDVNVLDGLMFDNATGGYGTIYTGPTGYYVGYVANIPDAVPEPPALFILVATLTLLAILSRRVSPRQRIAASI
jgi:hypothetical protein